MAEEKKQEQQVLVEEEYVEEQGKWSFSKYFKSIAHFKWWIIGFTLFGALAGYLGFRFIINPMKKTLVATYTYNLAGEYIDDDTIRFIDGSLFNPYELTSRENLEKVKNSNEKYTSINIDKLVANNAIVISKNAKLLNEKDTTSNVEINYVISAKANSFPNDTLGKEFLYDVINLAKDLSTAAIGNYQISSSFTENFNTITFEKEINQLYSQYQNIDGIYSSLISKFGSSAISSLDGSRLYELQSTFESSYYTSSVQSFYDELRSVLKNRKYVNYVEGQEELMINSIKSQCENYIQEIENNNRKIAIYQESLNNLQAITSEYRDDIAKEIASLTERITNIKLDNDNLEDELNNNGYFLDKDQLSPTYGKYVLDESNQDTTIYKLAHLSSDWVNGCKDFKTSIANYKTQLENDSQKTTNAYRYCYSLYQNKINIQNGGYVTLDGAISNWIGLAIGLAAGFIVTSLITATIYIYKED